MLNTGRIAFIAKVAFAISSLLLSTPAFADRLMTDQIGRQVYIPAVNRVVIRQYQTLNIALQLDAMDKVVGVLDEWKNSMAPIMCGLHRSFQTLPCRAASPW